MRLVHAFSTTVAPCYTSVRAHLAAQNLRWSAAKPEYLNGIPGNIAAKPEFYGRAQDG